MGVWSAILGRQELREISGVISRIGPILINDSYSVRYNAYAILLEDDNTVYIIKPRAKDKNRIGSFPQNIDACIALSQVGDEVSFDVGVRNIGYVDSFSNKSLNFRQFNKSQED